MWNPPFLKGKRSASGPRWRVPSGYINNPIFNRFIKSVAACNDRIAFSLFPLLMNIAPESIMKGPTGLNFNSLFAKIDVFFVIVLQVRKRYFNQFVSLFGFFLYARRKSANELKTKTRTFQQRERPIYSDDYTVQSQVSDSGVLPLPIQL